MEIDISSGFLVILLSVLGFLAGIVLLIVGFSGTGKKLTWAGSVLLLVSIVSLVFGIIHAVKGTVQTIEKGFKDVVKKQDSLQKAMQLPEDNWNNENHQDPEIISSLKKSVKEDDRPYIRKGFYHDLYKPEFYRLPLAFPFAIHRNYFAENNSELVDETALYDTRSQLKNTKSLVLNVTHFVFDEKMILLKSESSGTASNSKKTGYFLFEFGKAGIFEFKTERELTDMATKAGYTGSYDFFTTDEYAARFTTNN